MWFLINSPGNATVHIQSIDNIEWLSKYNPFGKNGNSDPRYTSELIYLLFYLPDIFPALNKIVIFDHDVVVQQDLSGLWNVNMNGNVNGAVGTCQEGKTPFHRIDAFINFSDPLIGESFDVNSCTWAFGMNLFDLQQWRRQNLTAVYNKYSQMVWLQKCLYFQYFSMILLFTAHSNFSHLNLICSSVRLLALIRLWRVKELPPWRHDI